MSDEMRDDMVVYGACCVWWDSIDKVGRTPPGPGGHQLPCCPHCGSVLLQMDAGKWFKALRDANSKETGYEDMLKWSRGKCFRTFPELRAAYAARLEKESTDE